MFRSCHERAQAQYAQCAVGWRWPCRPECVIFVCGNRPIQNTQQPTIFGFCPIRIFQPAAHQTSGRRFTVAHFLFSSVLVGPLSSGLPVLLLLLLLWLFGVDVLSGRRLWNAARNISKTLGFSRYGTCTGHIPKELGYLRGLKRLQLGHNKLNGEHV